MRLNPAAALVIWEKSHHRLSKAHRESFMRKVSASGLLAYEAQAVRKALRQRKRLDAAVTLAEELAKESNRSRQEAPDGVRQAVSRTPSSQRASKPPSRQPKKNSHRTSGSSSASGKSGTVRDHSIRRALQRMTGPDWWMDK